MISKTINLEIKATDNASGTLRKVGDSADSSGKSLDKMGGIAAGIAVAGLTALAGAMIKSVQAAASFETKMTNISTLISGDSTKAIKGLEKGILEMTRTMPKTADELGASAYDIFSAGITDTSKALIVLEESAKLATVGLGQTQEATDLMTSAINAFGLDAKNSDKIANILFKTVKTGKTTVSELAQSFGASAPVIAAAGISLEDFQAATAALTTTGLPASQAQMGLRQAIVSLQKPTKEMSELFEKLGVKDGIELIKTSENMGDVFSKLKGATEGNNEQWAKAIGSVEALNATTGLLDTTSKAYKDTLVDMKEGTDILNEAFAKQKETFDSHYTILKNRTSEIMIRLGNKIIPGLNEQMDLLTKSMDGNRESIALLLLKTNPFTTGFVAMAEGVKQLTEKQNENKSTTQLLEEAQNNLNSASGNLKIKQEELTNSEENLKNKQGELTGIQNALRLEVQKHGEDSEKAKELRERLRIKEHEVADAQLRVEYSGKKAAEATDAVKKATEDAKPAIDRYNESIDATASFLNRIKDGSGAAIDALKNISYGISGLDVGKWTEAQKISSETLGSRIPSYLKRQHGGEVLKGQPYIVGEAGREMFIPNQTGKIIPNNQINNNGGDINITIQAGVVNATEGEIRTFAQEIAKKLQQVAQGRGMSTNQYIESLG